MDVLSLGYQTDLAVRAAEGSQVTDCGDHVVVRSARNPTFWWRNFILLAGAPSPSDIDAWLARFAEVFPAARHRAFGVDVTSLDGVDQAAFTGAGLRLEHDAVLTASAVREPPCPNRTAEIRLLAGDEDWRQAAALRLACDAADGADQVAAADRVDPADGADQAAAPDRDDPAERADRADAPAGRAEAVGSEATEFAVRRTESIRRLAESGRGAWFGAFESGLLVAHLGLVSAGPRLARYQGVETHPDYRRQGQAGTLVWHAGRYGLGELGAATLIMVADPGYSAIRIYQSVGFARVEDQVGLVHADRLPPRVS